jgi:molybdate transport system substrate-binding protein
MGMVRHRIAIVAALALLIAACGTTGGGDATQRGSSGEVLVSAAASLTDAFAAVEAAFERQSPDIDVVLNLGGSSALREQIIEGAPVDIFASANAANMAAVADAGLVAGEPEIFALNLLQIAVPAGNPAGITGLDDFEREDLLIGLCAEAVPCGVFARESLDNAGVVAAIDTNEPDVRALLTKIEAGELDAGITYVTDVASTGGSVVGIDIPSGVNVVAEYPIAVLSTALNSAGAAEFVAFILSDDGRNILAAAGFGTP